MADDVTQALAPSDPMSAPLAAPAPPSAQQMIPISKDELGQWRTRIERARAKQKDWHKVWEDNLDAYQPKPADLTGDADRYDVNPNVDRRQVDQKLGQICYKVPDIILEPKEPLTSALSAAQVVTQRQALINHYLGPKPDGVDALRTWQRALLDILAISGIGWTKLGWRVETATVQPDDETLAMGLPNEPIAVPIYDRAFWDYIEVKRGLIPHDAIGMVPDDWDWIGQDFTMPKTQAIRDFDLPEDFDTTTRDNPGALRDDGGDKGRSVPMVKGTEIHYYRSRFNGDIRHPDVVYELVLIEGLDDLPARHRSCPYQTLENDGRLSQDSVIGYLIHPLGIRDAAAGAYPLSDSSITRALEGQLRVYLSQQVMLRDATQPIIAFKEDAIDEAQRDSLKSNGYLRVFPIAPDEWQNTDGIPIKAVALPAQTRDNYEGAAIIERKIEQSLGISSNQQGISNTGRRSATEIQTVSAATDTLMAAQSDHFMHDVLNGIRKLDALIQRMGKPTYVSILGPDGAKALEQVDPAQVPGRMLYTIKPDSGQRVDEAQDRQGFLQYYNLAAPSQNTNRYELDRQMAIKFGQNPDRVVVQPTPPPPPPPKMSVSISMADLLTPARPIAAKLLMNQPLTPEDFQMMEDLIAEAQMLPVDAQGDALPTGAAPLPQGQPEHPGPAEKAEQLDAHQERRTGGIEGMGVL